MTSQEFPSGPSAEPLPARREFLHQAGALGLLAAGLGGGAAALGAGPGLPLVIKGGRAWLQGRWSTQDIGVDARGRLVIAHPGQSLQGETEVDARGKVVAPGFVDILSDNRKGAMGTFERFKVTDGVTTALQMHGGSDAPASYYASMARQSHWVNYGVSAFATLVRARVQDRAQRLRQVERCLAEGALGVSYAIEYSPLPYPELLDYARLARKYDRPFCLHLRHSSREKELDGVREGLQLARESGARVHLEHLHSTGGTHRMAEALGLIREAIAQGLEITCCVYPYSYWATYPASERFAPGWQQRFGLRYEDLTVVGTGERLTEASFNRYRHRPEILVAVPEGTMPMDRTVDLALREGFCMIGSDGGIEGEPRANSHPRGAGCFATALRHGQDTGIPLERLLDMMSTLPRRLLRPALDDRAILAGGAVADLTVFDPAAIRSPASVANPNQDSLGIEAVIVHGRLAVSRGRLADRNGQPVRAAVKR